MFQRVVLALTGIAGAAGVGLGAVAAHLAAHVTGAGELTTASNFLLFHAAAATALVAVAGGATRPRMPLVAAGVMLAGVTLFAGDLAMRQLAGTKLLWGTAPVGGSLMIGGWLLVVVAAVIGRDVGDPPKR